MVADRPSIEQQLDEQVAQLDGLMADVRLGIRNQRHFDELEARAVAIATNIRNAFRKGTR